MKKRDNYKWLDSMIDSSHSAVMGGIGLFTAYLTAKNLFPFDPIMAVLAGILILVNIWRGFQYVEVLRYELDIVDNVFDAKAIKKFYGHESIKFITTLLTLSSITLIASTSNIVFNSVIAVVFAMGDLFGQSKILYNFTKFVVNQQYLKPVANEYKEAVLHYYFDSPLVPRLIVLFMIYTFGAGMAFVGFFQKNHHYYYLAYTVNILTPTLGEIPIYLWRKNLRRTLDALPEPES